MVQTERQARAFMQNLDLYELIEMHDQHDTEGFTVFIGRALCVTEAGETA